MTGEDAAVQIGVLAPLTRPGWAPAGEHLLAGMRSAVHDVNAAGGVLGTAMELVVRDTAASPSAASDAVDELARMGVAAIAGEYHSVAARAAAARAASIGIPFLCSSAVLDELTDQHTTTVARLAPPQSRGWRVFGEYLLRNGHRKFVAVTEPSVYWRRGVDILTQVLGEHGGELAEIDVGDVDSDSFRDRLLHTGASALVLLVGFPDPVFAVVEAVRGDPRLAGLLIGAPAGQPEFVEWATRLGSAGAAIPFLRYLPQRYSPLARRVGAQLANDLNEPPSFVAFEGYDTILVLGEMLTSNGGRIGPGGFAEVSAQGTRGVIEFSRVPGTTVWQWHQAPIQIVDRDPVAVDRFRILHVG